MSQAFNVEDFANPGRTNGPSDNSVVAASVPSSDPLFRYKIGSQARFERMQRYRELLPQALRQAENSLPLVLKDGDPLDVFKYAVAAHAACARRIGFSSVYVAGPHSRSSMLRQYVVDSAMGRIAAMLAEHVAHVAHVVRKMDGDQAHTSISFAFAEAGGAQVRGRILRSKIAFVNDGQDVELIPLSTSSETVPSKMPVYVLDIPVRITKNKDDAAAIVVRSSLEQAYRSVIGVALGEDIVDTVELNLGRPSRRFRHAIIPIGLRIY